MKFLTFTTINNERIAIMQSDIIVVKDGADDDDECCLITKTGGNNNYYYIKESFDEIMDVLANV